MILSWLILFLAAVSETFFLHRFGTTPGKALLGLKIVREDGSFLSLGEAARRSAAIAVILGLLELPRLLASPLDTMVGLVAETLVFSWLFWTAIHELPLPWERENHVYLDGSTKEISFWERKYSWTRVIAYILVMLLYFGLQMAGNYWASMPPNRGAELTVEEFVENYNFYDRYESGSMMLPRLMEDGTYLAKTKREHGWHFPWEDVTPPEFRFLEENGMIAGVTIYREWESHEPLREHDWRIEVLPGSQVRLCMLALGFDKYDAERVFRAGIDAEGNLHEDFDGLRADCETRFSGYELYFNETIQENVLMGTTGEKQSYFMEFTIRLER